MADKTCMQLVRDHLSDFTTASDYDDWKARHVGAWRVTRPGNESSIKHMILGLAERADAYAVDYGCENKLGEDNYWHKHAADYVNALLALLNFECGRFDMGTLDSLIRDIARNARIELGSSSNPHLNLC